MGRSKYGKRVGGRLPLALFGVIIGVVGFGAAGAQAKDPAPPAPKSIWEQDTLTGDWGGARTTLKDKWGIDFTVAYIGETLKVMSGGLNNRASYEGRGEFTVETNLEKFTQGRWQGATTQVTVFTIHNGSNYNALDNVGSIADPSNIDAFNTTRLFTAWFQQNFLR